MAISAPAKMPFVRMRATMMTISGRMATTPCGDLRRSLAAAGLPRGETPAPGV
jgi:hypothetical protein